MADIVSKIISNVLIAFYQPFWFALFATFLVSALYLENIKGKGCIIALKKMVKDWKVSFLSDKHFREQFFFSFYVVLILFRTLLNRYFLVNPLSDVLGGWTLKNSKGELSTEPIENFILFIPFVILLLLTSKEKFLKGKYNLRTILWKSVKIVFLFSISIEFIQLFLHLGTFQFSDVFYNTLGGLVGAFIYWIASKLRHINNHRSKE